MMDVVTLLSELIRIPSVNPDGDPGCDVSGEKECAEWIGSFLSGLGAEVSFEEVLPDRPNVIGRFPGKEDPNLPRLLLAPHLDTVSVAGMSIDPFGGEVRDGKVWGRGASDTKGTMAAMLWALQDLGAGLSELDARIAFAGLMGEETGQPGSRHFGDHHGNEFDFAVVGEPTELDIVHASKGCVWIELTAWGKAAHGATPEKGENAIAKLQTVLSVVLDELPRRFAEHEDNLLGLPTVNLGMIRGGSRTNIVPDSANASLDFRETPSLRKKGGVLSLLEEILSENGWSDEIEVKRTVDSEPLHTDPDFDPVKRLEKLGAKLTTAPWFCDAGWLSRGGIPSVACGPGNIAQAHTEDEFIRIDDLEEGARFYRDFLSSYLPLSE